MPEPSPTFTAEAVPPAEAPPHSMELAGVSERPQVRTVSFRPKDLPKVVDHDLSSSVAPAIDRGAAPRDLVIERAGPTATLRLRPVAGEISVIELGGVRSTWRGGLRVSCGEKKDVAMSIKKLQVIADGTATYTEVSGWFHASGCTASESSRQVVVPTTLLAGYLYAFQRCVEPCTSAPKIVFVTPPLASARLSENGAERAGVAVPFGFAALDVRQGATTSFEGIVSSSTLKELFHDAPPYENTSSAAVIVGAQISQDTLESEPTALGYGSRDPGRSDATEQAAPAANAGMAIDFADNDLIK